MRTAVGRRQEIDSEVVNFEECSLCEQQFYPLKGALVIDRLSNVSNSIPRNGDFFGHTYLSDLDFRKSTVKMLVRLLVSVLPRYMSSGKRDVVVKASLWAGHSPFSWVVFGDNRHSARTGNRTLALLETKSNFVNLCTPVEVGLDELLWRQYDLDWSEIRYTEALAVSKEDDRALSIAKESCVVVDGYYQTKLRRRMML